MAIYHDESSNKKIADDFESFIQGCKSKKLGHIRTIEERRQLLLEKRTIEEANEFLKNQFINIFNEEFSISRDTQNIWRKPPENYRNNICSRFERTVNSAGEISFQGYKFRINAPNCQKKKILLCIYKNGIKAKFGDKYYTVQLLDELTGGSGETMSESLKNIISRYMLSDAKKVCD